MKASVQYGDLKGSVSADIFGMSKLGEIAGNFNIDQARYDVVGLTVDGVDNQSIAFIAIDKEKSTAGKEHIVKIAAGDIEDLGRIFERLNFVLTERFRQEYLQREIDEEIDITED